MNRFAAVRKELCDVVAEALPSTIAVHDTKPDNGTAPLVFTVPGFPFLDRGAAGFGADLVHLELVLVPKAGTSAFVIEGAESLLEPVLEAVDSSPRFAIPPNASVRPVTTELAKRVFYGLSISVVAELLPD